MWRKYTGFSLIELMVVIAIVAVLSAVAVPTYKAYRINTMIAQLRAIVEPYTMLMRKYYEINGINVASAAVLGLPTEVDPLYVASSSIPPGYSINSIKIGPNAGGPANSIGRIDMYVNPTYFGFTVGSPTEVDIAVILYAPTPDTLKVYCKFGGGSYTTYMLPYAPITSCPDP